MAKSILGIAFALVLLAGVPAQADIAPLEEALDERVLGSPDAPVTMSEHSSLTCPHCANFHKDVFPKIKAEYIDTGKLKLVYRDFPLGNLAAAGSMLARCLPKEKFFGFTEVLFRSQAKWSTAEDPREELLKLTRFAGMTEDDFDDCLENEALFQGIKEVQEKDAKKWGIDSTPSFVLEGKVIKGGLAWKDFRDEIEKALDAKK